MKMQKAPVHTRTKILAADCLSQLGNESQGKAKEERGKMKSRLFFITFAVANLGLIAYGILALIRPEILLAPFLIKVDQLPAEATQATAYLLGLCRLLGYLNVAPGMLGLLMLYLYWRTRQAWFLKMLVAATILVYLGPVTFDNTVGTIGPVEVIEHILFAMVIISGFIMLKRPEMVS